MKSRLLFTVLGLLITSTLYGARLTTTSNTVTAIDNAVMGESAECFGFRIELESLSASEKARHLLRLYDRLNSVLIRGFTDGEINAPLPHPAYDIAVSSSKPYFVITFPKDTAEATMEQIFGVIVSQISRYRIDDAMRKHELLAMEATSIHAQLAVESDLVRVSLLKGVQKDVTQELGDFTGGLER